MVQSGARDWRARAGQGIALIGEGRAGVDAYHLAPAEIRHARVPGDNVMSGRRRSLTARRLHHLSCTRARQQQPYDDTTPKSPVPLLTDPGHFFTVTPK